MAALGARRRASWLRALAAAALWARPAAPPLASALGVRAGAAPPALGPETEAALEALRESAARVVAERSEQLEALADAQIASAESGMQSSIGYMGVDHTRGLQNITADAVAALGQVRDALVLARREAVRRGRAVATAAAQAEAARAGADVVGLHAEAEALGDEARAAGQDARLRGRMVAEVANMTDNFHRNWPAFTKQFRIGSAAANTSAHEAEDVLSSATQAMVRSGDALNDANLALVDIQEAARLTQHAAMVSTDAVDLAAQNSAKLLTISEMMRLVQAQQLVSGRNALGQA